MDRTEKLREALAAWLYESTTPTLWKTLEQFSRVFPDKAEKYRKKADCLLRILKEHGMVFKELFIENDYESPMYIVEELDLKEKE